MKPFLLPGILSALAATAPPGAAQGLPVHASASLGTGTDTQDLTELSLAELMDLEVTIASKNTEQSLSDVPAAVYVLTGDEIRRSGTRAVPEAPADGARALRLALGSPSRGTSRPRGFGTGRR